MKYKNKSEKDLRFRAYNLKGEVEVYDVKPGDIVETDRKINHECMVLVEEEEKETKTKKRGER